MGYDIGPRIGIEGEREFKQAISGINKDMAVLGSEMKKVTAQFDNNADSMEALRAKQDVLSKSVGTQEDKVKQLKAALENATKEFGDADNRTKDWQISLNKAEAELSKTKNELDQTSKRIDEFGDESKQSGDQVEKAGHQAKSSGDDAKKGGDGWEKLGHGLSKIGGFAADAVKVLAAASIAGAAAIGAITIKAGEAADDINTLSKVTGLSTEEIQKFKFASDRIDVSLETLTKSMAKNIKSMKAVQDGTKLSVDAYKKLGVEVLNADGSLRDGQTVYGEVIDALAKMENETERDALAMQILGKSAQELNPLILGGAEALKQMGEEAEKAGLILSQEQLDKVNAVNDAVDGLKATMQGVGMQFAAEFAGPISEGINQVTGFVTELLGAYKAGGMDALADKTGEVLGEVINKFAESLPGILEATTSVINGILDSVIGNIPQMTETGVKFFVSLITNAAEIITKIVNALPAVVTGITDALTADDGEMLKKMIDAGVDLFVAIVTNTAEIISIIADRLPEIVDNIATELTKEENLKKMEEAGKKLLIALFRVFENTGLDPFSGIRKNIYNDATAAIPDALKKQLEDKLITSGNLNDYALASIMGGYRASGGPVLSGSPYIVGEEGPELFVPKTSGMVASNGESIKALLAGIGSGDIHLSVSLFPSESEFTNVFIPNFRRLSAANPEAVNDF